MSAQNSKITVAAPRRAWLRRLVLGVALTAGVVAGLPRATEPASAAPVVIVAQAAEKTPTSPAKAGAPATAGRPTAPAARDPAATPAAPAGAAAPAAPASPANAAVPAAPATPAASSDTEPDAGSADDNAADSGAPSEVTIDNRGVTIHKSGRHRVRVQGLGQDREFDSFEEFVHQAPWLAGLVFLTVILLFVVPLLIVVLLIWYKIRKTRMQNETMLKLAERGVVPPAEAMETLAPRAPADVPPSAAPLYEQARNLQRRAAWSDLRKGVVLVAVGLAFIFYSMFDDGSPNWVGLICLFLGLGYALLWYFEDRSTGPARGAGPPPAGSA